MHVEPWIFIVGLDVIIINWLFLNQETEIARLKAALKEEQGKSQDMGKVVKYLENAKDTLEREKQALLQYKSSEVSVINLSRLIDECDKKHRKVDELTTKLNEAELKAKDFEEKLRLREKQALEVSFVISYF